MDKKFDSFSAGLESYCREMNAELGGECSYQLGVLSMIVIELLDGYDNSSRRSAKTTLVAFLTEGKNGGGGDE